MSRKVLDVENNEMVSDKTFLSHSDNIIIEYDGKKVGFNFKTYQRYVKKPDSDAVFVPCVFVDAVEYNTERNFFKENESLVNKKLKELDTDNDQMLSEDEIIEFLESFDIIDFDIELGLGLRVGLGLGFNTEETEQVIKKFRASRKLPFDEVKKLFDSFEYRVNIVESKENDKIKKFENETEEDFKKKFKKYLSSASFGFFKSNAMVLQDEIENLYNKGKRYIVLKKTKNKMSFIGLNSTLHNPDFYTNLQLSELINESGINGIWKTKMEFFEKPYQNVVFRSLKREFFTGPTDSGFKAMEVYKGNNYSKINGSLYSKFKDDEGISNEILEHIKNLDEVFINVASRSKDIITVFRAGSPLLPTYTPAFISTTTNPSLVSGGFGNSNNIMEIKIRPGTPYLPLVIEDDEREILLPRGLFFKKLGSSQKKRLMPNDRVVPVTEYEAYLPKYDPTDPINIKMETPHYNKYYDEVCKDFHVLEVDYVASEKSPKKGNRKSMKKSNSGARKSGRKSARTSGSKRSSKRRLK
jgi:hypothetical protein